MASPIKIGGGEKLISIKFPKETTSITSLDTTNHITVDVTDCKKNVIDEVKTTYGDVANVEIIAPELPNMNEIWYTTSDNRPVVLSSSENASITSIMVSNSYENGKGVILFSDVAQIGTYAFAYNSEKNGTNKLTSITIPDSVTSIGINAFYCSGLTSIIIPNSVTSIGSQAFYYCSGLTSVTIGNGVTSIGGGAFMGCSGLTSITIPDSITSIGGDAFSICIYIS